MRELKKLRPPLERSTETPAAEALTIGWMLTVMTALACELGLVVAHWYAAGNPQSKEIRALSALLLLASAAIGLLSLVLLPLVLKLRQEKPPLGIMVFAAVIGSAPIVMLTLYLVE